MLQVKLYKGIRSEHRNLPGWQSSAEYRLESIGGSILATIIVEPKVGGYPSVEFTVVKLGEKVLLFAQNNDEWLPYSNAADTARFYGPAQRIWYRNFPDVDFPLLEECQTLWRTNLFESLATSG